MTIDQLINVLATVTLVELMVTIGLGATFAEVAGVARNWRLVGKAALANYVCVPAAAVGLLLVFGATPLVAAGFLIAAACPGAPYGPPFTGIAKGNVVAAVGLMVLLAGSSALLAPTLLHFLLPVTSGEAPLQVNAARMVGTLLLAQFLPLCVGLAVRQWRPALAARLKKPASRLSMALNLLLLGVILTAQFDLLIGIPFRAYVGMSALVFAAVAAGWLLGGPGGGNRTAMTMATAVRNVGVALVIATSSFPGTATVTAATAFGIFQTVVMALVALGWGRLPSATDGTAREPALPVAAGTGVAKGAGHERGAARR
jgi:bile acid:Na+ symporter, BASS family